MNKSRLSVLILILMLAVVACSSGDDSDVSSTIPELEEQTRDTVAETGEEDDVVDGDLEEADFETGGVVSEAVPVQSTSVALAPSPPPVGIQQSGGGGNANTDDMPLDQNTIPPTPDTMTFDNPGTNPFFDTQDDNLSTFAMDVDTGSYTVMRNYLNTSNSTTSFERW